MRSHKSIHRVAILALLVVAVMSVFGSMRQSPGAPIEMRLAPLSGLAIWSLLLWKIWRRPRQWGIGVGISLLLMIALQSYFWSLAVNDPKAEMPEASRSIANFILIYQLPIFVAGVFCILLRLLDPSEPSQSTSKTGEQAVAPNRSLPPTLKPTSPIHGSDDGNRSALLQRVMTFEIEITRFTPEPVTERLTAATIGDAALRTQLDKDVEFVVIVAALDCNNVDWGNFFVSCNPERALIMLHEHREHFATDSQLGPQQNREVLFRDENGGSFSVPYHQTVSRDQALAALHFWLPAQKHTPELEWT